MELIHQTPLLLTPFTIEPEPGRFHTTLVVKGSFQLKPQSVVEATDAPSPVMGDEPLFGEASSLGYSEDLVPFKPKTDILLAGNCYAPGQKPVTELPVGFEVGSLAKSIRVRGERKWDPLKGKSSQPIPFSEMPLCYERAWGGPTLKENPVGVGQEMISNDSGETTWNLPNFEYPTAPIESPNASSLVAGLGPLRSTWMPRESYAGTFDQDWLSSRWPGQPKDFAWEYFNAAPADQQLSGYLQGNELFRFVNLHPQIPDFTGQLPGLRLNSYLLIEFEDEEGNPVRKFQGVALNLDTFWCNVSKEELVLIWRGGIEVRDESATELKFWYLATDSLNSPAKTDQEHYQGFRNSLDEKQQAEAIFTKEEAESTNADIKQALGEDVEAIPTDLAGKSQSDQIAAVLENASKMRAAAQLKQDSKLAEHGVDANPKEVPPATTNSQPKRAMGAHHKAWAHVDELEAEEVPTHQLRSRLHAEGLGPNPNEVLRELDRESFLQRVRNGEVFEQVDLTHLNLANADLSGAQLHGCYLAGVSFANAKLAGAVLSRSLLGDTDFTNANLTDAALNGADLSEANFKDACLQNANILDACLEATNFENANLSHANCTESIFVESNFSNANMRSGVFAEADLSGSILEKVDASEADFMNANLNSVNAKHGNFKGARFEGIRANLGASFQRANLEQAYAPNSVWLACDFREANLSFSTLADSLVMESQFEGADLTSSKLRKSKFSKANCRRAKFLGADLLEADFLKADLSEADLRKCNGFSANFMDAKCDGTRFAEANLEMTCLGR